MRFLIFTWIVGFASGFVSSNQQFTEISKYIGDRTNQPTEFVMLAHHKTGTALLGKITQILASTLGKEVHKFIWKAVEIEEDNVLSGSKDFGSPNQFEKTNAIQLYDHLSRDCNKDAILFFEDMRYKTFGKLLTRCKSTRVVHLVRRPRSIVESNWAYTIDLKPGEDRIQDVERGRMLRSMPVADSVKFECEKFLSTYANQMLSSHRFIQERGSNRLLEVRYEDLMSNYDNTTRTIFEHLLGKTHPSINSLVTQVIKFDKNRMPKSQISQDSHISGQEEKETARREMLKMEQNGDPCMKMLKESDRLMGYTDV